MLQWIYCTLSHTPARISHCSAHCTPLIAMYLLVRFVGLICQQGARAGQDLSHDLGNRLGGCHCADCNWHLF